MRARFSERPASVERSRRFMAILGLSGVLAALVLVVIGFNAPNSIPGRSYYTIQAAFTNADNLTAHYQVKANGKLVGQVLHPRVEGDVAVVDLQLDPSVKPLLSDTRIEVRPRSPVGVRYVDLIPGTRGKPLADGGRIPASQTLATRQLDELLGTFDPETRANTQLFLRGLATGFAGRGDDLATALETAPRFLRNADRVLDTVADRTGAMRSLIRGSATAAGAADPVREDIATGFAPEAKALRPISARGASVRRTLDKAPGALATLRSGLPQVDPFVDQVRGLAAGIRPGLAAAPRAFTQTSALLLESRPGLKAAARTLRTAANAVPPTLNLLSVIRPVLPDLTSALTNATPIVQSLGRHGCDFITWGVHWSETLGFGNSGGGVLRFNITSAGPDSVYGTGDAAKVEFGHFSNAYPAPCTAGNESLGG